MTNESKAEEYFKLASEQKEGYLGILRRVALEVKAYYPVEVEKFAVKEKKSLIDKLERKGIEYRITDALRFTLIIKHPNEKEAIINCLNRYNYHVWFNPKTGKQDITNRFENPCPGYKDISIKLVTSEYDALVKELQLLQPAMFRAKQEKGHSYYEAIKACEKQELKLQDPSEKENTLKKIKELGVESSSEANDLYEKALHDILKRIRDIKGQIEGLSNELYAKAFHEDQQIKPVG